MTLTLTNIIRIIIGKGLKVEGSYINPCPICGKKGTCHIEIRKGPTSRVQCSNRRCELGNRSHGMLEMLGEMKRERKLTEKEYNEIHIRLQAHMNLVTKPKAVRKAKKEDTEGKVIRNFNYSYSEKSGEITKPLTGYSTEMAETIRLFYTFMTQEGERILFWKKDDKTPIKDVEDLRYAIVDEGYQWRFRQQDISTSSRADYLKYLKRKAEIYTRFSALPEIERDPKTRYTCEIPKGMQGNGSFLRLLQHFTVKRDDRDLKNEYRLAAGFLSPFLGKQFDGKQPLFAIIADDPSSGKSSVVMDAVPIIQNGERELSFSVNDQDNKKALSSVIQFANRYALFDNLTSYKQSEKDVITHCITDRDIASWIMYTSHGRVPNNKTYFATFNRWFNFGEDIMERSLVIRMEQKKKVTEEQRRNLNRLIDSLTTEEIMEDIWFNLKRVDWNTEVPHIRHQKNDRWSRAMAKVLHQLYPKVKEFDFALSDEDIELDMRIVKIGELIDTMYRRYVSKPGGQVAIPNRKIYEEWENLYPTDYFAGHQKMLTSKIKSISDKFRSYYVDEGRLIPSRELQPSILNTSQQFTQQRCFIIRQKTVKTIEYDDDDIIKLLTKWGVQKAKAQRVVDVMKETKVTPENRVEMSKKILRRLELLSEENLESFIELFGETEKAVSPG
jgi:hypothetical protein